MRRRDEDDLFDDEQEESHESHMEKILFLLEESDIEYIVKTVSGRKNIILENDIVFGFGSDEDLVYIRNNLTKAKNETK